jgi:hypothetical protein
MDKWLEGPWEEFEQWIRDTIEADFRWCIRPRDTQVNREMVASLILNDIKSNAGVFPEKNSSIERA